MNHLIQLIPRICLINFIQTFPLAFFFTDWILRGEFGFEQRNDYIVFTRVYRQHGRGSRVFLTELTGYFN